mmetsp:Transcript_13029/g.18449  ORF Transcript_13029/g.18449 Transcript_13029/m.18449 type:complete len:209 (-) Transcript_13029:19-645(-)
MPSIVLKKTFKELEHRVGDTKELSFHGTSVTRSMIDNVNDAMKTIKLASGTKPISFTWDGRKGHYVARMDYAFQKAYEEDAVAEILDVMEGMGWNFRFQYDAEFSKNRFLGNDSETSNELWIFSKEPEVYQVHKGTVDVKVGISLTTSESTGLIKVKSISEGGLFEATGIQPKTAILSINGVPCKGKSASEAVKILSSAVGRIKIMTY